MSLVREFCYAWEARVDHQDFKGPGVRGWDGVLVLCRNVRCQLLIHLAPRRPLGERLADIAACTTVVLEREQGVRPFPVPRTVQHFTVMDISSLRHTLDRRRPTPPDTLLFSLTALRFVYYLPPMQTGRQPERSPWGCI